MNNMKRIFMLSLALILLTSCATMFYGKKSKVVLNDPNVKGPVTLTVDGERYSDIMLPAQIKVKRNLKPTQVIAEAEGYEPFTFEINKKFNGTTFLNLFWFLVPGMLIDVATGAIMAPDSRYYFMDMQPTSYANYTTYQNDPTIVAGEASNMVSRDAPGQTALERTIIRWAFRVEPGYFGE